MVRGGQLVDQGQRGAPAPGTGCGAQHQQPPHLQRLTQPQVAVRLDVAAPHAPQLVLGHRTAAHRRHRPPLVQAQMDVADVGAVEHRAVEGMQIAVDVEGRTGGAAGPGGSGHTGLVVGGVGVLLLPQRGAGQLAEALGRPLAFALLLLFLRLLAPLLLVLGFRGVPGPVLLGLPRPVLVALLPVLVLRLGGLPVGGVRHGDRLPSDPRPGPAPVPTRGRCGRRGRCGPGRSRRSPC